MKTKFLYETFDAVAKLGLIGNELPESIEKNLKADFEIRPYQREAFCRMIYFLENNFEDKQSMPYHLLFNMATGSGKTLVMAGAMLWLYEKGYRNFLFFVNSNNIIRKTKDNFLNTEAKKYLFAEKIFVGGERVRIREVETFEETDDKALNIKFTTIQQLHIDLTSAKENAVSMDDFRDKKLVLIADEAHHLNAGTKSGDLFGTFEDTVQQIHGQNYENILLEFTATMDYEEKQVAEKYADKVLFRYVLSEFRKDRYSKDINLLRTLFEEKYRVIQALLLNLYRQELATENGINLKPVILFKAKRTIGESEQNKKNFHKLIDDLCEIDIDVVRRESNVPIIGKAMAYFERRGISDMMIVDRLRQHFRPENCLSANDDKEAEKNQILLNTLEDGDNPVRAVFAVHKLNEGWDVLNLFDIVRMYEDRNEEKGGKVGRTTIAEAQLIGRGARYFPFAVKVGQNKFMRKYDSDVDNELRVLEELYYHAREDSRYISELRKALVETGIYEDESDMVDCHLTLKESFKQTDFYKKGHVVYNLKVLKNHEKVKSLEDLKVRKKDIVFELSSGRGMTQNVWDDLGEVVVLQRNERRRVTVRGMPSNVVRFALATNPFYDFDRLQKYCPSIKSTDEFMTEDNYLGGFGITFVGDKVHCENITNVDYLQALKKLLKSIETEILQNDSEYEGSAFTHDYLYKTFTDKTLHINKKLGKRDVEGQKTFLMDKDWYVYNANYGTSEEVAFVNMFAARFESIRDKFAYIYLVRNEQTLKIYDEIGRVFEPDYVLFCKQKHGEERVLQLFIEPKGEQLKTGKDKWKEEFLKQIRNQKEVIKIGSDRYEIIGVPFYNKKDENEFAKELNAVLE